MTSFLTQLSFLSLLSYRSLLLSMCSACPTVTSLFVVSLALVTLTPHSNLSLSLIQIHVTELMTKKKAKLFNIWSDQSYLKDSHLVSPRFMAAWLWYLLPLVIRGLEMYFYISGLAFFPSLAWAVISGTITAIMWCLLLVTAIFSRLTYFLDDLSSSGFSFFPPYSSWMISSETNSAKSPRISNALLLFHQNVECEQGTE